MGSCIKWQSRYKKWLRQVSVRNFHAEDTVTIKRKETQFVRKWQRGTNTEKKKREVKKRVRNVDLGAGQRDEQVKQVQNRFYLLQFGEVHVHLHTHTHSHTRMHTYIYIGLQLEVPTRLCACVRVCVSIVVAGGWMREVVLVFLSFSFLARHAQCVPAAAAALYFLCTRQVNEAKGKKEGRTTILRRAYPPLL